MIGEELSGGELTESVITDRTRSAALRARAGIRESTSALVPFYAPTASSTDGNPPLPTLPVPRSLGGFPPLAPTARTHYESVASLPAEALRTSQQVILIPGSTLVSGKAMRFAETEYSRMALTRIQYSPSPVPVWKAATPDPQSAAAMDLMAQRVAILRATQQLIPVFDDSNIFWARDQEVRDHRSVDEKHEFDSSKARTALGRRLLSLRKQIVNSGAPLLDWEGLERSRAERWHDD